MYTVTKFDVYFLVLEKLEEQKRLESQANEERNHMDPENEQNEGSNVDHMSEFNQEDANEQMKPDDNSTEMLMTPKSTKNVEMKEMYQAKERLTEKENKNLELKIKLAREQRLLLQAKTASSTPVPSAGNKLDINDNSKTAGDDSSVGETTQGDVFSFLDLDGASTTKTMSHSIEHEGWLNSRDMLKLLEPHLVRCVIYKKIL